MFYALSSDIAQLTEQDARTATPTLSTNMFASVWHGCGTESGDAMNVAPLLHLRPDISSKKCF